MKTNQFYVLLLSFALLTACERTPTPGPQGPTGETGAQGPKGDPGAPGTPGSVNAYSYIYSAQRVSVTAPGSLTELTSPR